MKFFIDTANLKEISEAHSLGLVDGVTTNPSLCAKEGIHGEKAFSKLIWKICDLVQGPVSAEVLATQKDAMVAEARKLAQIHEQVVVKIPMTAEGLKATRILSEEGIKVNVTLIFQAIQAMLAAKAGAAYVSPFIGRLDDINHRGMDIVNEPVTCKGVVTKKYVADGQKTVECRIWIENRKGETTSPGTATVVLP